LKNEENCYHSAFNLVFSSCITQDESEPVTYKNVIKANTLTLIIATGSIFYERRLTDITAAQLGVGFMS